MQSPKLVRIDTRHLVGTSVVMSLSEDKTSTLWQQFMPRKKEVLHVLGTELYSVQVYPQGFDMADFTPETMFEKWAAVAVNNLSNVPAGMDTLTLPGGLYAVFVHKGSADTFYQTAQYIYGQWLPQSGYKLDNRPHFEILGAKYLGPANPESEEEVWIPVQKF